jgi:hypothetical protein
VGGSCQFQLKTKASGSEQNYSVNHEPCPSERNYIYEYNPSSSLNHYCAVPLGVGMRLKSPVISDFRPYLAYFKKNLSGLLNIHADQLYIVRFTWEIGPRLNMQLKIFPSNASLFNVSEIIRLRRMLAGWEITLSDIFGPYELLYFTLGPYANGM